MKFQLITLMTLVTNSTLSAGWRNFWPFISGRELCGRDLKSAAEEFKKRQDAKIQCGLDLKKAALLFKRLHDREVEERRELSDLKLATEIMKPTLSKFFTHSKPSLSMVGIFNTSLMKKFEKDRSVARTQEEVFREVNDPDCYLHLTRIEDKLPSKIYPGGLISDKFSVTLYHEYTYRSAIPIFDIILTKTKFYQKSSMDIDDGLSFYTKQNHYGVHGTGQRPFIGKKNSRDKDNLNDLVANYFIWEKFDPFADNIDRE